MWKFIRRLMEQDHKKLNLKKIVIKITLINGFEIPLKVQLYLFCRCRDVKVV